MDRFTASAMRPIGTATWGKLTPFAELPPGIYRWYVDIDWFFSEENLAKLSDEELLFILRDLQEIQKEKRGGQAGGASG